MKVRKPKRKMKPGGGRDKGALFEREVAKLIIKAFACYGIKRKDCYRTPLSGGHRFASKLDPGDLVVSARMRKLFPFSVEAKHHKNITGLEWGALLCGNDPAELLSWWRQTVRAAKTRKLEPLLVFKQNFGRIFAMYRAQGLLTTASIYPCMRTRLGGESVRVVLFSKVLAKMVERGRNGTGHKVR